ncbi:MAG: hypothetical protein KatS3mg102_0088 [Planctomycetota bacterium]|nr:MAG: hypothetical protein KatS3mg102_0088 [Planctomycetota bacterium]
MRKGTERGVFESLLGSILESATDGIFVVDREERVVVFNSACERLTGLRRDQVLGGRLRCDEVFRCHRFSARRPPGRPPQGGGGRGGALPVVEDEQGRTGGLACGVLDILRDRQDRAREEILLVSRDGTRRWIETSFSPVLDGEGRPAYTVGILRVIDDRKRAEAEVQRKNRELERALAELRERTRQLVRSEKMASIGQLAAGIAHELNTPLNTILGHSQLARELLGRLAASLEQAEEGAPGAGARGKAGARGRQTAQRLRELAHDMEAVEAASKRCRDIVQSLLVFSRPAASERTQVELGPLAERVLGFLRHGLARAGIVTRLEAEPGALVLGDEAELEQVLLNLAKNAADAMPRGGRLEVSVATRGQEVVLAVTDTGPGVAPADRQRIFEPFYTTKPAGSGTGLGLAIVARIVEEHGGRIEVDAAPGGGARFWVRLPRAASAVALAAGGRG